jgi:hypothetical protein
VTKELVNRYVNNLYRGIVKYSVHPFKFVCFSNDALEVDEGVTVQPFPLVTRSGVLPRMFMFSEDAGLFGHKVLCLDIDVVVTGSLRDIMNYDGLYCTRTAFAPREDGKLDGDIQCFQAGKETEEIFWSPLVENVRRAEQLSRGRERYWVRQTIGDRADVWNTIAPNQIFSYKRHVLRRGLPKNARIVSCHGYPRPHQIQEEWRTENWK